MWVKHEAEPYWEINDIFKSGAINTHLEVRKKDEFIFPISPRISYHPDASRQVVLAVNYIQYTHELSPITNHVGLPMAKLEIGVRENITEGRTEINYIGFHFKDERYLNRETQFEIPKLTGEENDYEWFVSSGLEQLNDKGEVTLQMFFRNGIFTGYNFGFDSGREIPVHLYGMIIPELKTKFEFFISQHKELETELTNCLKYFEQNELPGKNNHLPGKNDKLLPSGPATIVGGIGFIYLFSHLASQIKYR